MVTTSQVAVCGAGLAGYSAAISALEAGADVVLLEKSPAVGGAALLSGGLIWTFADLDELCAAIPDGNPVLQERVVATVDDGRRWLAQLGVRFTSAEPRPDLAHGGWDAVTGEPGIRGLGQQMEPAQMIDALAARFLALGGVLRLGTALDSLLTDGPRAVGVRAVTADGDAEDVFVDAVVLATGGFAGNPELLARYVVPASQIQLRSHAWSTGDGFIAATAAGAAATAGLDTFYGHAMLAPPGRFRPIEFGEVTQGYGQGAVALNLAGQRFADESEGTGEEILNQRLARQPQGLGFYVFDDALASLARTPGKAVTRVVLDRARAHGGTVLTADSLPALCDALVPFGIPSATALATLEGYNRMCSGEPTTDHPQPGRRRFRFPVQRPPFHAVGVKASVTATLGGLAVDDEMRVLRRSGSSSAMAQSVTGPRDVRQVPIGGLFAAGGDVGDISRFGYLGGLATALTTGRIAGSNSAA